MSTRNLTCVVHECEYKVAKYCQWNGYLDSQGKIILDFLSKKFDKATFLAEMLRVRKPTDEEIKEINSCKEWAVKYPFLSRDMGGDILEEIQNRKVLYHIPDVGFAKDSLFCEFAYVIDLDKDTFEVYKGFVKTPISSTERFYFEGYEKDGYYPVKLLKEYKLDSLPCEKEFFAIDKESN